MAFVPGPWPRSSGRHRACDSAACDAPVGPMEYLILAIGVLILAWIAWRVYVDIRTYRRR